MANLLEKASIVLTPTGYSVDAIHNVKPSESTFGDMTLVQNGTTTRVNESGFVVSNITDIPRIDYSKGEGAILSEAQSINQVRHSEDLTQSPWAGAGEYTSSVIMVNPTGNTGSVSNIFRYSAASNAGRFQSAAASSTGQGVGISAWVYNPDGGTQTVWIGDGNVGSGNGSFHSVTNSWQRIEHITSGGTFSEFHIAPAASSNLRVWGCQFEIGTLSGSNGKVTSYIPTASGSVTRVRDNYRDGGDASLIGAQEGVLYIESATFADAGSKAIALSAANSAANRVVIFYSIISNTIQGRVQASATTTIAINGTVTDNTDFNKIAFKYKSGDLALWINGTEVATSTTAFTFNAALSELAFDQGNGTLHMDGFVKQLVVFKEVLSDAELAALTS
tara:strand:+ start:2648 stop:3820 length:1173 start_codon:yes stop_codon:yes gene_type:complete